MELVSDELERGESETRFQDDMLWTTVNVNIVLTEIPNMYLEDGRWMDDNILLNIYQASTNLWSNKKISHTKNAGDESKHHLIWDNVHSPEHARESRINAETYLICPSRMRIHVDRVAVKSETSENKFVENEP